jgi:PAS domain-containing protein
MKKPSDIEENWESQREKIIGLGERSLRKTYYPELQQKLDQLERFRALLDQSNDCIFLIHVPTGSFIDVNESACRQLGCSRQEVLALPLERFSLRMRWPGPEKFLPQSVNKSGTEMP